ncbi:ABC transporter ATP-binding protein [Frondihabitans cladoniiphilus]|uniref:Oligopeptide ABC transporter ATP-binding protein Opp1F n=1 Tax=Frondihabitans cladoniiphilus TaxID=715785 RepID=A0ABP8W3K6_9MICO
MAAFDPTTPHETVRLEAVGVSKSYGARRSTRIQAVDNLSFAVDSTMSMGIVGESGSGKSTLARMLTRLETPTSGSIVFNGRVLPEHLPADELHAFRRTVQYIAQDTSSSFDPRRTLRDAVRAPARRLLGLGRKEAEERVDEVLGLLHLPVALADRKPAAVSGGQRQRFSIARALVVRPRILVCDEVVSALDVSVQGAILNELRSFCATHGTGLVFVSHGLPATAFISRDLTIMKSGHIVETGSVDDIVTDAQDPYTRALLAAHADPATSHYSEAAL